MKVVFNNPRIVGGKLYPKGKEPVELGAKDADHWFTKACMKSGDISLYAEPAPKSEKDEDEISAPQPKAKSK